MAGRTEWGVKVYGEAVPADSPARQEADGARPGTAYLRRRSSRRRGREEAARLLTARAERVHDGPARHAVACHRHRPQDPRLSGHQGAMVLNAAYLVDDDEAFLTAAEKLRAGLDGVRLEVTGPWPAYSFAAIEER